MSTEQQVVYGEVEELGVQHADVPIPSVIFLLDDSKLHSVNLTTPELGNPGIGGTEFQFVSLAYELAARRMGRITLVHRNRDNTYPKTISTVALSEYPHGLRELLQRMPAVSCVVVRGHDTLPSTRVIECIPAEIPIIAWTHNHLRSSTLSYLAARDQIKRIAYVGKEQYALAAGAPGHHKSTYISNGLYLPPDSNVGKELRAVYVGHLVPEKGFHRVARLWPRIRRACPTAKLDVIGSSEVYQPEKQLGRLGIASHGYEKLILKYLGNDPARYGVVFHGRMGTEKYGVMSRAMVGLPNPTGFTECCPGSALEMSACRSAVVALRQWGMCDTVLDQVSGFLCNNEHEYVARVVSLFSNPSVPLSMGIAGRQFVSEAFSYTAICEQWVGLFNEVLTSAVPNYPVPAIIGMYPLRRLRTANRRLQSPRLHALLRFTDRIYSVFLKRF